MTCGAERASTTEVGRVIEAELKARVSDPDRLRDRLRRPADEDLSLYRDTYYDRPGRSRRQLGALAATPAGAPAAAPPGAGRLARIPWNLGHLDIHQSLGSAAKVEAFMLPLSVLSEAGRTRQERLRRRNAIELRSTLD
jgi:hypothetical protein